MTRAGLLLAVVGAAVSLAAPLGTRAGVWPFMAGFAILALGAFFGAAGAGLSAAGGVTSGEWPVAAIGILLGLAVAALPVIYLLPALGAPPIHDITTDAQDPPRFDVLLSRRADAPNPPEYGGAEIAARQRRAYPDIQPLVVAAEAPAVFARAVETVRELGWEVAGTDASSGRIEAVDTTFWFGFRDDVVIRVRAASEGTRVDVRSKSRVGRGDAGTNARRVRGFLGALHHAFMSAG